LKRLQAKEVVTSGESVERVSSSQAASNSNKKTRAELAFQKTKQERVTDHKVSELTVTSAVKQSE